MTDAAHPPQPQAAPAPVSPAALAATLAARLCHDFMSPASGIVAGLELLDDPAAQDMRDEAMGLVTSSARKLIDSLTFYRAAFGPDGAARAVDVGELETLARGVFSHVRPDLEWAVGVATVSAPAAKALLNMVQIAAGCLAAGGLAKVKVREETPWTEVVVEASGPRARLWPEVLAGLHGQGPGEGLSGRWVQAYYLQALTASVGGAIAAEASDGVVILRATIPRQDPSALAGEGGGEADG